MEGKEKQSEEKGKALEHGNQVLSWVNGILASLEHKGGKAMHDRFSLKVEVAKHRIAIPAA
jgi:hypothetical protein